MSLRGTSIGASVATSQTASLTTLDAPGGGTTSAVANDVAILMCCSGYALSAVAGWSTIDIFGAGVWNYYFATKTLSSGDISTGSVTVNQAGNYDGVLSLAVFTSGTSFIERQIDAGTSPKTLTCTSSVLSSSIGVYWVSARGGSTPSTPTVTPGAGSATAREDGTTANANSRLWTQAMPGGAQANVFAVSGSLAAVFFQAFFDGGGGGGGQLFLPPSLDGLSKFGQLKGGCNG